MKLIVNKIFKFYFLITLICLSEIHTLKVELDMKKMLKKVC